MATASEFWARIQPSGLTAEQELVALWQTLRDCKKALKPATQDGLPVRRRVRRWPIDLAPPPLVGINKPPSAEPDDEDALIALGLLSL